MGDTITAAIPLVNAAATAVGAAASGYSAIKGASMKTPKTEKTPAVTAPAVAPTQDDAAIQRARLEAVRRRQSASGRQSTNLTDDDRLG
jgi:hypothetical protein